MTGPVSFLIKLPNGQLVRRHQDHLRRRQAEEMDSSPQDVIAPVADDFEPELVSGVQHLQAHGQPMMVRVVRTELMPQE